MPLILALEPHRESWAKDFEAEASQLQKALGPALCGLHHIGSTAVSGIYAKPIIDILAEVASLEAIDARLREMQSLGYESMGEFGIAGRRYFRKDDSAGMRTHQVHAFVRGSPDTVRHLAFRDYLRSHVDIARAYSELKRRLVETCDGDFERYMDGKNAFIQEIEKRALVFPSK